MTFDELNYLAVTCRDKTAADALLRVTNGSLWELPVHSGVRVDTRAAVGYIAGYYEREEQLRLWELFETEHPLYGPTEALTGGQLLMMGVRAAARGMAPEHRQHWQQYLDARDYTGLREWLRTPLDGEPPWPDSSEPVMDVIARSLC